jgi:tetratricopeptide (TPR) repeat protein
MVEAAEGRPAEATEALLQFPARITWPQYLGYDYAAPVRALISAGQIDGAQEWLAAARAGVPRAQHGEVASRAIIAEALGHLDEAARLYADATSRWEAFLMPYEQALSLLGRGRCLIKLGQLHDAAPVLRQARKMFDQLGATPALAETETLVRRATALSS